MKIGINGIFIRPRKKNDGIGRYSENLIEQFANYPSHKFIVFTDRFYKYRDLKVRFRNTNIKIVLIPFPTFRPILAKIYTNYLLPLYLKYFNINLYFSPYAFIPSIKICKYISTIHDVAFFLYPNTVNRKTFKYHHENVINVNKICDAIITVSDNSKKDIVKYYNVNEIKVKRIYNGISRKFYNNLNLETNNKLNNLYSKYQPYMFSIGTIEPRKNFRTIFTVFSEISKTNPNLRLLIVGSKGWETKDFYREIEKMQIRDKIVFLGNVMDDDIIYLLQHTELFIYIPLYEGFGLPVAEAMSVGARILTSNCSSLPEICDESISLVDPLNVDEIVEKVKSILNTDRVLNKTSILKAKEYTWEISAKKHIELFEKQFIN